MPVLACGWVCTVRKQCLDMRFLEEKDSQQLASLDCLRAVGQAGPSKAEPYGDVFGRAVLASVQCSLLPALLVLCGLVAAALAGLAAGLQHSALSLPCKIWGFEP